MDAPQQAFAKHLSGTLQKCGVKRRYFDQSRNLTEFLMDLEESGASDEREIAAMAVEQRAKGRVTIS